MTIFGNTVFGNTVFGNKSVKPFLRLLRGLIATGILILSGGMDPDSPAWAAERIGLFYPPLFEVYLSVSDLEIFAREGRITNNFAFYAQFFSEEGLQELRIFLNRRFQISHVAISQFTYSPIGEEVLSSLSRVLLSSSEEASFHALRGALILAAAEPEGLTLINFLRKIPFELTRVDLGISLAVVQQIGNILQENEQAIRAIQSLATRELSVTIPSAILNTDLSQPGTFSSKKVTFSFHHQDSNRTLTSDIYLPMGKARSETLDPAPLVLISHGVASDRKTFAYLAQHLASYGFAAAALEHPGTSIEKIKRFLVGIDTISDPEAILERPGEIKALLQALAEKTAQDPEVWPLDIHRVGILGQSLGGYTALAAAGAPLNDRNTLQKECESFQNQEFTFNLSLFLQCRVATTPTLEPDPTHTPESPSFKAVIAINPVTSALLGKEGLSQLEIPVLMISGSNDFFAPPVPEQVLPFTWLKEPDKYLVLLEQGTHFSFLGGKGQGAFPVPEALVGPNPVLAWPYLKALSIAFFKRYLDEDPSYEAFLSQAYLQQFNRDPFQVDILRSLTEEQINESLPPSL
jgi:predicted dienelactone hydrolase